MAKDSTTHQSAPRILLFGDSIIAGYGLDQDQVLSVQLQNYILDKSYKVHVINGGVSGDTTAAGRSRLAWTLQQTKPDLVFLALGGNDILRGIPPQISRQNLEAMLQFLQDEKIDVILSRAVAPPNLGRAYQQAVEQNYQNLAAGFKVPLYPFLLESIFHQPDLMLKDGIHPSAKGIQAVTPDLGDFFIKHLSLDQPQNQ